MGFIPEITCRRCGTKYSGLRNRCPQCGAPRMNQPTRVPPTTASVTPNSAASGRSAVNVRWQFIFGAILVAAVILAVIVLIVSGGGKSPASKPGTSYTPPGQTQQSVGYTTADLPTPSPSPDPTPEASPTSAIENMSIAFLNKSVKNHDLTLTNAGELTIDLDLNVYPQQENAVVTWKSSNEKILTVDERGIVKVVGVSPNFTTHAVITAECCGVTDYVVIYIPAFQASYLTENLYDPETYEADNLEWDTIIYASPSPKP